MTYPESMGRDQRRASDGAPPSVAEGQSIAPGSANEMLAERFSYLVWQHIQASDELSNVFGARAPGERADHKLNIARHVLALLEGDDQVEIGTQSLVVGAAHIHNNVRPSWYVRAYNLLFAAYHELEDEGVKGLPALNVVRAKYLLDVGMTLDTYFDTMRGTFRQEHAELSRTVSDLELQSRTDPLTNLFNRRAVAERLAGRDEHGAFVLFDLDGFKAVNDLHGHLAGDRALCEIAAALQEGVRSGDLVARLGGDEFCVWSPLSDGDTWEHASTIANRLVDLLPLVRWGIGVSGGLALCPEDGCGFDELYEHADQALYRAKSRGWMTLRRWGTSEELVMSAH